MTVKRIRPVAGKMVPRPNEPYEPIPSEGCRVEFPGPSSYWIRRLREGVIEIVPDAPAPSPLPEGRDSLRPTAEAPAAPKGRKVKED